MILIYPEFDIISTQQTSDLMGPGGLTSISQAGMSFRMRIATPHPFYLLYPSEKPGTPADLCKCLKHSHRTKSR